MTISAVNKYHRHKINVVGDKFWNKDASFLLWFGACGPTYILCYGHLNDALEDCAEWLLEHAPGNITTQDEMTELYKEACEELDFDWDDMQNFDDDEWDKIREIAEADLTYTESGWITSYEWGIVKENPNKKFLVDFYRNET